MLDADRKACAEDLENRLSIAYMQPVFKMSTRSKASFENDARLPYRSPRHLSLVAWFKCLWIVLIALTCIASLLKRQRYRWLMIVPKGRQSRISRPYALATLSDNKGK